MENKKPVLVFQAPIATRSGYGERSRDLLRALIALDKYDIKVVSTRWGNTPMNALSEKDNDILSRLLMSSLPEQPEIFMQVTVPNEFQRIGKFNIGVTAGIETNLCDPSWIEGCNRMDLILASSNHAKRVFEISTFDKMDSKTKQNIGTLKLEKPVEVLFEGIRLDTFKKEYTKQPEIENIFSDIKEDFNFLFVGHWLPGSFGEDRKNVSGLIKTFYESFKDKQNAPGLILKTSAGTPSIMDRDEIINRINQIKESVEAKFLPNVYLIHGDLTEEEINDLYNHPKVKAHVSFTKGEGFGRPLMEAALTNKPIITSNWSGHLDFLNAETSVLVSGKLTKVHASSVWKGVINAEADWFSIDYNQASAYMKDMFKDYKKYLEVSRKTYHHIKTNFSFEAMTEKLKTILESKVVEAPKLSSLTLPKLQKPDSTQIPSIQLPKLKKIEA
jgi:glycosyltransferase involved in cell wall biosynthesis